MFHRGLMLHQGYLYLYGDHRQRHLFYTIGARDFLNRGYGSSLYSIIL